MEMIYYLPHRVLWEVGEGDCKVPEQSPGRGSLVGEEFRCDFLLCMKPLEGFKQGICYNVICYFFF